MDSPEMRAGDSDRRQALDRLGTYFADGFLTVDEFDERSEAAVVAVTRGELDKLFDDLPRQTARPAASEVDAQAELDAVARKSKLVQRADIAIGTVAMIAFFLGLFVFNWSYFWVVFPIAGLACWAAREVVGLSDEEEDLATEINEKEAEERKQRLRLAAERRRELGQ